MANFGQFNEQELNEIEALANSVGLTTTAFHYRGINTFPLAENSEMDLSWISAHYPDKDAVEGQGELTGSTINELGWKIDNWSQWHDDQPLL